METRQSQNEATAPDGAGSELTPLLDRINWNDRVTLTTNDLGWHIWEKQYRDINLDPPEHGDELEMCLWEAAQIFGPSLYNGCKTPFDSTFMRYRKSV
jgi:hypothetical protein